MIGIFVTFAAFLLAFFALVNPIIKFRLNMRLLNMRRLFWLLIILGVIAILQNPFKQTFISESNLLEITSKQYDIDFNSKYLQLFYEISVLLWNSVLVGLSIYLFSILINPVKFNSKNAKYYVDGCNLLISSGINENIGRLTSEVSYSIPTIFDAAMQDSSETQEALVLLELFSDEKFCKSIVNHNPVTLSIIFDKVIQHSEHLYPIGAILINQLIALMFSEPDSQLNREERYGEGLGRFGAFKKLVFGKLKFLKSEYRPLSKPFLHSKPFMNAQGINKYFEVIEYTLDQYLAEKRDNSPDIFSSAFHVIKEVIENNILNLSDAEVHSSDSADNILACSTGISFLISFLRNKFNDFPLAPDITKENYSYFNDRNIYGAIAVGIFDVIEQLARKEYLFENIRLLLVKIYIISIEDNSPFIKALRSRLDILLSNKIEDNLVKAYYPAVTASLIYSFGLSEPEQAKVEIEKKLLVELKKNYLRLYTSRPKIALDMIPQDTELDIKSHKLVRKHPIQWIRDNKVQELILDTVETSPQR